MEEKTYRCEECLREKTIPQGATIPICCGRPMAPKLQGCRKPFVAETARADSADEPCDDGTSGGAAQQ